MAKKIINIGVSVRQKLLDIARQSNRDYNALIVQYFQERLLYRISISPYRNNFILKGAFLFLAYEMPRLRPTKDIDFLGTGISNDPENIKSIIEDIISLRSGDGVLFDRKSISTESITEGAEYNGFRIKMYASLDTIRQRIQMDIGFGDTIVPAPVEIEYPTIIDIDPPKIKVYTIESAIAEKFEALVKLSYLTSRYRDIYDILFLAQEREFLFDILNKAINTTFKTRGTSLYDRNVVFSQEFSRDKSRNEQWEAFLKRNELDSISPFSEAMHRLKKFLEPVCVKNNKYRSWNSSKWVWR